MTDLYTWWNSASRLYGSIFRTEDYRIWYDEEDKLFRVAYRSPLWARLPVRVAGDSVYDVLRVLGVRGALQDVKGTIKR